MNASRALAELAIETSDSDLGEAADTATRHLILDTLGTAIAGWQAPGMAAVVRSMERWGGTLQSVASVVFDFEG